MGFFAKRTYLGMDSRFTVAVAFHALRGGFGVEIQLENTPRSIRNNGTYTVGVEGPLVYNLAPNTPK